MASAAEAVGGAGPKRNFPGLLPAELDGGTGCGTTAPGPFSSEPEVQDQPWINSGDPTPRAGPRRNFPDFLPAELGGGTGCENHRAGPK